TDATIFQPDEPKPQADDTAYQDETPKPSTDATLFQPDEPKPTTDATIFQPDEPKPQADDTAYQDEAPKPSTDATLFPPDEPKPQADDTAYQEEAPKPQDDDTAYQEEAPTPQADDTAYQEEAPKPQADDTAYQEEAPKPQADSTVYQTEELPTGAKLSDDAIKPPSDDSVDGDKLTDDAIKSPSDGSGDKVKPSDHAKPKGGVEFFPYPVAEKDGRAKVLETPQQRVEKPVPVVDKTKPSNRARIWCLNFKGMPIWAWAQFCFWVTFFTTGFLFALKWIGSSGYIPSHWTFPVAGTVYLIWFTLILKGSLSLIGLRTKAFEVFFNTFINMLFPFAVLTIWKDLIPTEEITIPVKFAICLYGAIFFEIGLTRLKRLRYPGHDNGILSVVIVDFTSGTPSTVFFLSALRLCFVPFLYWSLKWCWGFEIPESKRIIEVIYYFLWASETVRIALKCWAFAYEGFDPNNQPFGQVFVRFLYVQYILAFAPALGIVIMWVYNYSPQTWTYILFSVYGFIWLLIFSVGIVALVRHDS
ncbi:MAG: hypothetical protein LBJ61_12570, partial [Deltaproteobacteria bacterium]|nr:hypothetical protein [Deltaproteobacteria bacterium]